ncbi:uncharacterized protein A1O9_03895 [Exophiala aquamarina CBS 119918]|uniref:MOSC domain-containing protein n=1 Tax=Exophiala aquamarina CBS 119918 TaxID=1182545 RepID=A0A072PH15_9EURO|nr:uncharacterized protein A1O9_03895 [Exophiala aquamarina CBS 119918]KEF59052.1 hypothetical protein A1O9_03895 [Exophiala aquamarina CBS 119918]
MDSFIVYLLPAIAAGLFYRVFSRRLQSESCLKGHKKLATRGLSNLLDEYDQKYFKSVTAPHTPETDKWRVKALFIHPIKSCAPVELSSADIDGAGFTWDRKFAFAELLKPQTRLDASEAEKEPRWTFRTLRTPGYEKLVHVKPEIWLPVETQRHPGGSLEGTGFLIIRYPYTPSGGFAPLTRLLISLGLLPAETSFRVPLTPPQNHRYPIEQVTIWRDSPNWLNYGLHVPSSLSVYLGVSNPMTLFRVEPKSYREVYRCAPRREQLGYQSVVGFADAYPVNLLNISSVHDIGDKIKSSIPRFSARRFRPNILVAGPNAYNEDDWKKIRVGSHVFFCACHTVRCKLPNVDPDTAERHPVEPDKTLKSFRCIDDGDPLNACLGLQLVPAESDTFSIQIGDEIEILERGEHHYIKQ